MSAGRAGRYLAGVADCGGLASLLRRPGQAFHESRTGLDHISFGVADRADLGAWASWLDELGIEHSGVIDTDSPVPYSVIVFRDPDNIHC